MIARHHLRELRGAPVLLAISLLVYGASHAGWHAARDARMQAVLLLEDARSRLHDTRQAQRTLDAYQGRYVRLRERGIIGNGAQAGVTDAVRDTAGRLGIAVQFETAQAYTLRVGDEASARVQPVHLELALRHEAELLRFMDAVTRAAPGVLWVRRCEMARADTRSGLNARCRFDWVTVQAGDEDA